MRVAWTLIRDDEYLCIFLFPGAYFPDEGGVDSYGMNLTAETTGPMLCFSL